MNALKFFLIIIFVLAVAIGTGYAKGPKTENSGVFENGITYQSFFDPRASGTPAEGDVYSESLTYRSFFDHSMSTAPAKGKERKPQYPMLCWGGQQCLWN